MSIIIVWKMRKQSTAEQRKKMKSKRREVSKLSLSIFSPGQFININLFFLFFVLIYIFSPLFPRIKRLTRCFFPCFFGTWHFEICSAQLEIGTI